MEERDDHHLVTLGMNLKSMLKNCRLFIEARDRDVVVYAVVNMKVDENDEKAMSDTCEYITRANYGLVIGNFELDHRDGEVRYKASMPLVGENDLIDRECLDRLVTVSIVMLDRYGKGLGRCMLGLGDPEHDV